MWRLLVSIVMMMASIMASSNYPKSVYHDSLWNKKKQKQQQYDRNVAQSYYTLSEEGDNNNSSSVVTSNSGFQQQQGNTNSIRDSRYFPFANPNVNRYSMYYADAHNVLQDLSRFKRLYVTYHNCAWSYKTSYSSSNNNVGGGSRQHVCDSDGSRNESWYAGFDGCMGANAAYSLYGARKGTHHSGCYEPTYINSFVTANGLDVFAPGIDTSFVTNICSTYEANSTTSATNNDGGGTLSGDDDLVVTEVGYYSVTTGCSVDGTFTTDMFAGQDCHGANYVRTLKNRRNLNSELAKKVICKKIYDESTGLDYATLLLMFSEACTIGELGNTCPDPYGLVAKYERNLDIASRTYRSKALFVLYSSPVICKIALTTLYVVATLFLIAAKFRRRSISSANNSDATTNKGGGCIRENATRTEESNNNNNIPTTSSPLLQRIQTAAEANIDKFNSAMEMPAAAVKRSISNATQRISRTISNRPQSDIIMAPTNSQATII